ncbi:hypothetical protein [Candidatus Electrothrix sp.]|uniref:hypothetical protein n=1 Tax=Candidatus Electrothrix sp. TaxID=2170559 RepID=UPI0040573408
MMQAQEQQHISQSEYLAGERKIQPPLKRWAMFGSSLWDFLIMKGHLFIAH